MKNLRSIAQRIRHLPKEISATKIIAAKGYCEGIRLVIVNGLMKNNLVTPPLKPSTIKLKTSQGKPHIYTALVGWGQTKTDSMINGLRLVKTKNGYALKPVGKHYSTQTQELIWAVHEYGAVIQNGFGKGILIKIPPRYPVRKGIQRWMKSEAKKKSNKDLQDYFSGYLSNNKSQMSKIKTEWESRI